MIRNYSIRKINLAAENNKTAASIREHLTELNSDEFRLTKCEYCSSQNLAQARNMKLYRIDIEMLKDRSERHYVDLILNEIRNAVPLPLEVYNTFYDLRRNLTIYLRPIKKPDKTDNKKREGKQKNTINAAREGQTGDTRNATFSGYTTNEVTMRMSRGVNTDTNEKPAKVEESTSNTYNAVPPVYERINKMSLFAYLGKEDNYKKVRMVLAYLRNHKDAHYNGETYVSTCTHLRSLGFPKDDQKLYDVYMEYSLSQGFDVKEVEEDLRVYGRYMENRNVQYINAVRRDHHAYTGRSEATGRCDPECTIL